MSRRPKHEQYPTRGVIEILHTVYHVHITDAADGIRILKAPEKKPIAEVFDGPTLAGEFIRIYLAPELGIDPDELIAKLKEKGKTR